MRLSPPGTHFSAESTEAMRIKCLAQGNNILLLGFEPSTSVSKTDILANRPICSFLFYFIEDGLEILHWLMAVEPN